MWLRIYRSGYEPLSLERVYVKTDDGGPGGVAGHVGDPGAVARRTRSATASGSHTAPYTVTQTPDGDYPMRVVLPAIEGDAPTPLRVTVAPASGLEAEGGSEWLIAAVAGTDDLLDTLVNLGGGDGFTEGPDSQTTSTGDAEFFGGNYRTLALPGTDSDKLLMFPLPVFVRGRYKTLLRIRADADATYLFNLSQGSGEGNLRYESLTVGTDPFEGWVDIGDYSFPAGVTLPDEFDVATSQSAWLRMWTAGDDTGEVTLDALMFIPVSGPTVTHANILRATFPTTGTNFVDPMTARFDGDAEMVWMEYAVGGYGEGAITTTGGFPVADPASARNLLYVVAVNANSDESPPLITTVGAEAEVTVSYHPRYLHLPGDA